MQVLVLLKMCGKCDTRYVLSHLITVMASILLFGAGGVMLYYRSNADATANANGYIVSNAECTVTCDPDGSCSGLGSVQVQYQLYNETDIWYNGTSPTPMFCGANCCDTYIHDNITVYFLVDDGDVVCTLDIPAHSSSALVALGIISLVLGCMCMCVSVLNWTPRRHHYTIIYAY